MKMVATERLDILANEDGRISGAAIEILLRRFTLDEVAKVVDLVKANPELATGDLEVIDNKRFVLRNA